MTILKNNARFYQRIKLTNIILRICCIQFLTLAISQLIALHDGEPFFAAEAVINILVFSACTVAFLYMYFKAYYIEYFNQKKNYSHNILKLVREDEHLLTFARRIGKTGENQKYNTETQQTQRNLLTEKPLITQDDQNQPDELVDV